MALDSQTEEIRRRADLVEIVEQYVSLRPAGGDRFKACCPFHDEKTPSFNVSRDKGFYKCFGCLEENELIWTEMGLRAIRDVKVGERVLDFQGNWQKVLAREHKTGPLLALETGAFRNDPLLLTPDHTCLCVRETEARRALPYLYQSTDRGTRFKSANRRNGKTPEIQLREVSAEELNVGDFWVFPVVDESRRSSEPLRAPEIIAPYVIGKRVRRIEELPVDEETAFVYGLYGAEGSTNPRSVRWTFHRDEKDLAGEVARVLETRFGLKSTQHLPANKMTREVICCNLDLARQLEYWFGKGCAHKTIPAAALSWPREIQRAFLRGYLCGDGDRRSVCASVSVSRALSYGLFALGVQCGVRVSLSHQDAYVDKSGVSHRETWHFFGREREGLDGFYERIGDTLFYWSRLRRIEVLKGEHRVVDISVAGTQTFVSKMAAVHNCGVSGDVFKFLMNMENITFGEARKSLAERYGIKLPEKRDLTPEKKQEISEKERLTKVTAAAAHFFREQFSGNAGLIARDYARKRGLSRETLEMFGIGYAPDAWDALKNALVRKYGFSDDDLIAVGLVVEKKNESELGGMFAEPSSRRTYDRYRHRLMFPIWDESGRVVAFGGRALDGGRMGNPDAKYINSPETPLFHKSNILFGWHIARSEVAKRGGVIITEGYMDAIALHEGGFPNTVATLGTALTAQHVALLRRMSPKSVWLCFDGDSAGIRAALRTAPLFAENGLDVRVVRLPGEDDPDTFIRSQGEIGMQSALDEAVPLARYRLESAVNARDLNELGERAEAMREAAEIINDLTDGIEREGYVNFLVDTLLTLERPSNRGDWERRRTRIEALVESELKSDSKRFGATERLREARQNPVQKTEWKERPSNPKWEAKQEEQRKESADLREATQSILADSVPSGVVKAEKALLGVLVGHPAWRERVFGGLALEKWTSETHAEIWLAVRAWPAEEPIAPVEFNEKLSEEAQSLVAEVMLSPGASAPPDGKVVDDWMARVEWHWAQRAETETLEMIRGKIDRGEVVSSAEKEILVAALVATRRKTPVLEK